MLLSIITTGRNDNYSGNFVQRITWQIEKLCETIVKNSLTNIEIIVVDWGSPTDKRLSDVVGFKHDFLKWLWVPTDVTTSIAGLGFSNSHAWNVGARKSSGEFLLHTEGDCYLPSETLIRLLRYLENKKGENLYAWASRYNIPTQVYLDCESISEIDHQIEIWKSSGKNTWEGMSNYEIYNKIDCQNFWGGGVAQLTSSRVYNETSGVAEIFTKWGYMDKDFHNRVISKYEFSGDLEYILNSEFLAFGHHDIRNGLPWYGGNQDVSTPFVANGENWGLNNYKVELYN